MRKFVLSMLVALMLFGGWVTIASARFEVARDYISSNSGQNRAYTFTVRGSGRNVSVPWSHSQFQVWTTVNTPRITGNHSTAGAQARSSNNIASRTGIVVTERGNGSAADRSATIARIALNRPNSRGTLFDR